MKKVFGLILIFLIWNATAYSGDIWAIHGVDSVTIVKTNPEVIQFMLFMDWKKVPSVSYVENDVTEQKKGKYDIYVGEDHADHQVRFGAYTFDWPTRHLTAMDPDEVESHEAAYNKCCFSKITVDSSYPGYSFKPLIDCSFDKKSNFSAKERAWASAEKNQDHWIQINFDQKVAIQKVRIYWAWDKKKFYPSKNIRIFYRDDSGKDAEIKNYQKTNDVVDKDYKTSDSDLQQTQWLFPSVKTDKLMVKQIAGGGSEQRPNLMWISQVWAY